ncbi:TetR/AcrR family transcriptional regulator [Bacilliculturomica massiliensis]|uniref:TetR/AcrR family transcriptional regulator n=1 Tax=Bacilliculturomica massiliensis TaxID=1917867 RepID=UPI00102F4625|nr:TetR/AcrR family transcriptional regulator [Bacilliculturomica massiliensis]
MERENKTKKRIRRTALELFQQKSFEKVTLNEICEKSGVNKHTFYYYFKSKDELLDHYYEIPDGVASCDLSSLLTADSYVEQFWLLIKKMIDFMEESGVAIVRQIFIKNMMEDVGTFNVAEKKKEMIRAQIAIIKKGQEAGQFRNQADARFLAILFHQIAISTAFMWSVRNASFSYSGMMRYMYEMAFDVAPEYRKADDTQLPGMGFGPPFGENCKDDPPTV